MRYYFAPMEGITGYIYRNAHHEFFPGVDRYFTPFIAPSQSRGLSHRERMDVLPEHNRGIPLVPQILANAAERFVEAAKELEQMGYREVNLNLGCPSGTVVKKRRGSGLLAYPDELDAFLDGIYEGSPLPISIKTRIGRDDPEEFHGLMEIFHRYPVKELIIHPRTQKDLYKGKPHMDVFRGALTGCRCPVCYNGDLSTAEGCKGFSASFGQVGAVMLGRGLITDPNLVREAKGLGGLDLERLRGFHDMVYAGYQEVMDGDRNVLFKMKELWCYLIKRFQDAEKPAKRIKKAERLRDYESAVSCLFQEGKLM